MRQLLVLAVVALLPASAAAQWGVWRADSLLAAGRLDAAESTYFAAVRARPRDPVVRAALGKFLAARGETIAASVLLEEARDFGGDSAIIARALAPLYLQQREFGKLGTLRPDVLSEPERRRVAWLAKNPPSATLPDSIVLAAYRASANGDGIGTVMLRIGGAQLPAVIDPRVSGLVLPSVASVDLRAFGTDARGTVGVLSSARIGAATLTNIPTIIGDASGARIGFDVLSRHSPTFDPVRGTMILRREPPLHAIVPRPPGTRVPTLMDTNGMRLLIGGRWQQSSGGLAAMLLASRVWLWDAKRGDVVLQTP
jgi:hypothetical protein